MTGSTSRGPRAALTRVSLGGLALLIVGLYGLQLAGVRRTADRTVGVLVEQEEAGVRVTGLSPGGPAERDGIEEGDVLVEIEGYPIRTTEDYDVPAAHFERGRAVRYLVERSGEREVVIVRPGVAPSLAVPLVNGLVVVACLSLAVLVLWRGSRDLRVRLLGSFLLLVAMELALPFNTVGELVLDIVMWSVYFVLTGAQIAVELHLASMIPDRRPWMDRHRWVVPSFYVVGLGLGLLTTLTYLLEDVGGRDPFPWTSVVIESLLTDVGLPVWALLVVLILGSAAFRWPQRQGRLQAGLVLLGVLPWALYVFTTTLLDLLGREILLWADTVFPLVVLIYPVAVAVAIFRAHLFDLEGLVRRGFVYTALTTALVLVFYGALGVGGALSSRLVGDERHSLWVVSAATLLLGLLFAPLRSWFQQRIDQALFPERDALRQRLAQLAGELPAQGKVPAMARYLVERTRVVFSLRSASLLVVEPRSGLLLTAASSPADLERRMTLSFLLSSQDPGVELVRAAERPVGADAVAEVSPALGRRLDSLGAVLAVPLQAQDKLVGILALGRPEAGRHFPPEEVELLNLLAHQAAVSFENARLFGSATYESLTGLLRREAILEILEREIDRARRYSRPLTVGFADLDHFKDVNDRHGHLAGDALLKIVAGELASGIRTTDVVGRYGGEEFLLVFPETDLIGASVVAEKIRRQVEGLRMAVDEGPDIGVEVSIGLADLDGLDVGDEATAEIVRRLLGAADDALYRAKRAGRNRVEPEPARAAG